MTENMPTLQSVPTPPQPSTPVQTAPASTTAATSTGSATSTGPATPKHACSPGCKDCLKGGLPLPKELTTFLLTCALAVLTIGGVLFVTNQRKMVELERQVASSAVVVAQPVATPSYPMPKARTYVAPITLPKPRTTGGLPLDQALSERRTRREFSEQPVSMTELGQMLWAAQGVTEEEGLKRTAPSAREGYPFTIYIVVRSVSGLEPGLYEYLPVEHALGKMPLADASEAFNASGVQEGAQVAPVVFIESAALAKSFEKMGANAINSTMLEGGHIGQNFYLEAESLNMGLVVMAGFKPDQVRESLNLDPGETPVYVIPFGHRAAETAEITEDRP